MPPSPFSRRDFLKLSATAALGSALTAQAAPASETKIKLGMDNFAVRAMGWKAHQLIDHAQSLKLDTLFISDLDAYESYEPSYLAEVKAKADSAGVAIYVGSWSICPSAVKYNPKWGNPKEHITLGIKVAKALGSPVFRVIQGTGEDRKSPGGIEARIDDMVKVLKENHALILDSGIKIAVENHAGDMQSREILQLIERAGPEICGINIDSGNHAWTLEDPVAGLDILAPYVICSSLRDEQVWETPEGATVQWTAMGEGAVDWDSYVAKWKASCPNVPIQIETISGFPRSFPYLKPSFWETWPKARAQDFARFVALAKKGLAIPPFQNTGDAATRKAADQAYQKAELERSITYCREKLGLGARA